MGSPGNSTEAREPPASAAWLVWGLGAALYLIAFYQRVAPAVMTDELTREFGLSAAGLGNLSAFYFYSYVAVQIPTGLLADRWGPRRVLTAGAALTALGTLTFALAPGAAYANAGRLAIGAAAGVAFVSMLKLASHWMPLRRFALASGVALFIGTLGATLAGAPLRVAVDAFGWRPVMLASAILTAAVAAAIWVVVRDDPSERGYDSYFAGSRSLARSPSIAASLREVFRYRNVWLIVAIPGGFSSIVLTFAGLWGVPFLATQHGFTTREAAMTTSAMLIAWAIGGLVFAQVSQRLGARKPVLAAGLVATLAAWGFALGLRAPAGWLVVLPLVAAAFLAGAFILTFAFAKESVPARLGGTVSGIANMGVMLGGMFMQPLVGWLLDRQWSGALAGGVRVYDLAAFQWAFAPTFAWGAAALALIAFARETHCRQTR